MMLRLYRQVVLPILKVTYLLLSTILDISHVFLQQMELAQVLSHDVRMKYMTFGHVITGGHTHCWFHVFLWDLFRLNQIELAQV